MNRGMGIINIRARLLSSPMTTETYTAKQMTLVITILKRNVDLDVERKIKELTEAANTTQITTLTDNQIITNAATAIGLLRDAAESLNTRSMVDESYNYEQVNSAVDALVYKINAKEPNVTINEITDASQQRRNLIYKTNSRVLASTSILT